MEQRPVEYVTFRAIATGCAKQLKKDYSIAYEEYFKKLIDLYLSGRGNHTLKVYASSSSLFDTFGKDPPTELKREVFWRLVKHLDCMPCEIRSGYENLPEHGSSLWKKIASVGLADYPESVRQGYFNYLYVRIATLQSTEERQTSQEPEEQERAKDVREFAMLCGPHWLVEWLEAREGRPLESLERAVQIWLDRQVKTAKQSGQKLKEEAVRNEACVEFPRLRREDWRVFWANVSDTMKHRGRPPRKSRGIAPTP